MAKKSDRIKNKKAKRTDTKGEKKNKLSRKKYESELAKLEGELVNLQSWVKEKGLREIAPYSDIALEGSKGIEVFDEPEKYLPVAV